MGRGWVGLGGRGGCEQELKFLGKFTKKIGGLGGSGGGVRWGGRVG